MASQAQIATMAVLDVGGQAISSIDNQTQKEASIIRDIWDITRDEILALHEWGFAKGYKALALESEDSTIDGNWTYVYALPNDHIKLLKNANDFDHVVRGQSLYCDTEDVVIGYIKRIEDTSKYPTWFVKALVAKLRTRLHIPLAKRGAKVVNWYQIFLKELDEARNEDARQNRLGDDDAGKHTVDNDSWVAEALS